MTIDQIIQIMSRCPKDWAEAIVNVTPQFDIDTPLRLSAFIAQVAHESSELTRVEENLNYSAERLVVVFPKYFPTADTAIAFHRNSEMIANKVYGGRMGNTEEGDGWKFRGRGPIQLTGRENYTLCGNAIKRNLTEDPELLLHPLAGIESACWFWNSKNLNTLADHGDFKTITKRINGGYIGLEEREKYYGKAKHILGV
jgi:putative chitinase